MDPRGYCAENRPVEANDDGFSLPADRYARAHALSIDHLTYFPPLELHPTQDCQPDGLTDASHLPRLHLPKFSYPPDPITGSQEAVALLNDVIAIRPLEQDPFTYQFDERHARLSKLKIEAPILQSDPDHDVLKLMQSVNAQRDAHIELEGFPFEPLDASLDQDATFPPSSYDFNEKLKFAAYNERIDVTRDTIDHLTRMLHDDWKEKDQQNALDEACFYRKTLQGSTVTPPLSPRPQADDSFIPDSSVFDIPNLSDASTLMSDDLLAAQAEVLVEEPSSSLHNDSPSLSPMINDAPLFSPSQLDRNSLEVEVPLMDWTAPPASNEALENIEVSEPMLIDHLPAEQADLEYAIGEITFFEDACSDDELLANLIESADNLLAALEQETLEPTDALCRVKIPVMEFTIDEPGWKQLLVNAQAHLTWVLDDLEMQGINHFPPWAEDHEAAHHLDWCPFSSKLAQVSFPEKLDHDILNLDALVCRPDAGDVPNSANYVWKQEGLAILREQDDDEDDELPEVSVAVCKELGEVDSPVRRKGLQAADTMASDEDSTESAPSVDLIRTDNLLRKRNYNRFKDVEGATILMDSRNVTSVSALLENYLELRGTKYQKTTESCFFAASTKTSPLLIAKASSISKKPSHGTDLKPSAASNSVKFPSSAETRGQPITIQESEPQQETPAPCPAIPDPLLPVKIIKSLTLSRGVLFRFEALYPQAEIIERNFSQCSSFDSKINSSTEPALVSEADVIVSPVTGIVVTPLLKAIQRSELGPKRLSSFRARLSEVALRYERLIILVSQGKSINEIARAPAPSQCRAYAEFCGFVHTLDTSVQVYYVGGGEETLAKWLVTLVSNYAPEDPDIRDIIMQEETSWELFLRRAGLNAYAAQVVLGLLQPRSGKEADRTRNHFGMIVDTSGALSTFVKMMPEQRIELFSSFMGGDRVLGRVNELLETSWDVAVDAKSQH